MSRDDLEQRQLKKLYEKYETGLIDKQELWIQTIFIIKRKDKLLRKQPWSKTKTEILRTVATWISAILQILILVHLWGLL